MHCLIDSNYLSKNISQLQKCSQRTTSQFLNFYFLSGILKCPANSAVLFRNLASPFVRRLSATLGDTLRMDLLGFSEEGQNLGPAIFTSIMQFDKCYYLVMQWRPHWGKCARPKRKTGRKQCYFR